MTPKTCHRCSYDLTGLPATHQCPECGAEYDELTRVWKPARPWKLAMSTAIGGFYLCVQVGGDVVGMFGPGAKGTPNPIIVMLGSALALAGLVTPIFLMARARQRDYRLATSPEGIVLRVPGRNELIPWIEVLKVRRGELYSGRILRFSVTIDRQNGKPISVYHILRSDADVAEFIALCEKAREQYTGQLEKAGVKAP